MPAAPPDRPEVKLIAAVARNGVIGTGEGLPWSVPEDYAHFLDSVRGEALLMGRRSWTDFGRDVAVAEAFVLTHRAEIQGAAVVRSIPEAIARCTRPVLWVAGGATVYRQALEADLVDELVISEIHLEPAGSVHFPELDPRRWQEHSRTEHEGWTLVRSRRVVPRSA